MEKRNYCSNSFLLGCFFIKSLLSKEDVFNFVARQLEQEFIITTSDMLCNNCLMILLDVFLEQVMLLMFLLFIL